jgi:hypothetical protein
VKSERLLIVRRAYTRATGKVAGAALIESWAVALALAVLAGR